LLIEILAPTNRFTEVRQGIDEHLAKGLRYIWLFDPVGHHVYIATPELGFHEFKGDVLRTENPVLELPLIEVFA
jgi:Uma2 family endonuclease